MFAVVVPRGTCIQEQNPNIYRLFYFLKYIILRLIFEIYSFNIENTIGYWELTHMAGSQALPEALQFSFFLKGRVTILPFLGKVYEKGHEPYYFGRVCDP